jgi:hypothetical protein
VYLYAGAYDSHQRCVRLVWYFVLVAPHAEARDRSFNSAALPILAYNGRPKYRVCRRRRQVQMAVDGIPIWILANGKTVVTGCTVQ